MHDGVLEHRVDRVERLPLRRILRRFEAIVADVPQRRAPLFQHVLQIAVGFPSERCRLRRFPNLRIR
jgi:hypothetical protein